MVKGLGTTKRLGYRPRYRKEVMTKVINTKEPGKTIKDMASEQLPQLAERPNIRNGKKTS